MVVYNIGTDFNCSHVLMDKCSLYHLVRTSIFSKAILASFTAPTDHKSETIFLQPLSFLGLLATVWTIHVMVNKRELDKSDEGTEFSNNSDYKSNSLTTQDNRLTMPQKEEPLLCKDWN